MHEVTPNRKAFLDMLAFSEIGAALLQDPRTDRGYKVIVGSTPVKPILMANYQDHPRRLIILNDAGLKSTAAGRYQLLARYFDPYKKLIGLYDFGPDAQDQIALQQIAEQGALEAIDSGHFQQAVAKVCDIWASLPGAGYHQHENYMAALEDAYERAGGTFA
jgi:muramidase (phage lysozyme)